MSDHKRTLASAYLFDWVAGDPEWFPHPVRLMGKCIQLGEHILRKPGESPRYALVAGSALSVSLVAAAYLGTAKLMDWTSRRSRNLGILVETTLAWTCLASRSLHQEASSVVSALDSGDLVLARQLLRRIVGRDTEHLDTHEISRAVIETVAESSSDGVIAPLFYMAIGGVPLAMAYKAINTLDSMIGHADQRYFYFGKVAARMDDAANFIPSRLSALYITLATLAVEDANPGSAFETWLRDGMKHKSPNAGQPESAMSGALQVRLGGTNYYAGAASTGAHIGESFPQPSVQHAKQAIRIAAAVSVLGIVTAFLVRGKRR